MYIYTYLFHLWDLKLTFTYRLLLNTSCLLYRFFSAYKNCNQKVKAKGQFGRSIYLYIFTAMLPAWIYSLGVLFIADKSVKIPFSSVAISLAILLVPLAFGVLLRTKFPDMAKKVQKALKPVIVFSAIILITVGVYSNLYIFRLFEPRVVLAACLLPYIGYLIGGVVSAIFRQPWRRIKTIIIETGMQNTSIAYILLTTSFVAPMGDLAAVAPVASAVMTPLPPFLITVCYLLYQKFQKRYDPVTQDGDELQDKSGAKETEQFKDKDKIKEYNVEDELMNKKLTAV